MKQFIIVTLFWLIGGIALSAQNQAQLSLGYLHQGSDLVTGTSWFGLNGGRGDVTLPWTRHWGFVAELSGVHTNGIAATNTGLTLFTYMAGPRFSFPFRSRREAGRPALFAQMLFGGMHQWEGALPAGTKLSSSADSFALAMGGGLEVGLSRKLSLRAIQADYLYTRLPNLADNYQNNYRVGTGLVLRLR
jgi:hypothetical protein